MVWISDFHESDDDSVKCLNLDYYLSDNMEMSPKAHTEVKTSIKQDPPLAPPTVTVTVQLEDELVVDDLYERHRVRNQKRALRC